MFKIMMSRDGGRSKLYIWRCFMFKETIRRGKVRVHGCPASREQLQGTPP
jgi:hypothetical protein